MSGHRESNTRAIIVAECATSHGGNLNLAEQMIHAAAQAGADYAKFQTYSLDRLNPNDPQAAWLRQAHLDEAAHRRLMAAAKEAGIRFLSTPFDRDAQKMLYGLGQREFKIASSEAHRTWWQWGGTFFVSWPWGERQSLTPQRWDVTAPDASLWAIEAELTAIPLYPTPLEAVGRATLLDGWSDHCEGLSACYRALALGVKVLEVHLTLPDTACRRMPFDKTPDQLRQLRAFADDCLTMSSGVAQRFRERWSA